MLDTLWAGFIQGLMGLEKISRLPRERSSAEAEAIHCELVASTFEGAR